MSKPRPVGTSIPPQDTDITPALLSILRPKPEEKTIYQAIGNVLDSLIEDYERNPPPHNSVPTIVLSGDITVRHSGKPLSPTAPAKPCQGKLRSSLPPKRYDAQHLDPTRKPNARKPGDTGLLGPL